MAVIRRAGFGSVFEVENEKVGIGTTGSANNTLQALGRVKSSDAKVIGVSTISTYQGFIEKQLKISDIRDINSKAAAFGEIIVDGEVSVSSASTFTSNIDQLTATNGFSVPTGDTNSRVHCHTAGSMRFNEELATLEFYTGDEWRTVNAFKRYNTSGRGLIMGGNPGSAHVGEITSIQIPSQGNSVPFGDLSLARSEGSGASNDIRGLCMGGYSPGEGSGGRVNNIDYVTIASSGTAINFGDLSQYINGDDCACASSTRAMRGGGYHPGGTHNTIDYVEIMTLGDAQDFGDLTDGDYYGHMAASSPIRALWAGGGDDPKTSQSHLLSRITAVTIASKGNSTDIGDLTERRVFGAGLSNNTRAIFAGGYGAPNSRRFKTIDSFTMASTGHAQDFGNLSNEGGYRAGTSTQVRGVIMGGYDGNPQEEIEMITIATKGSVEDFGNDTTGKYAAAACSDSHGGLGGY